LFVFLFVVVGGFVAQQQPGVCAGVGQCFFVSGCGVGCGLVVKSCCAVVTSSYQTKKF
jgi:hypothetical protein